MFIVGMTKWEFNDKEILGNNINLRLRNYYNYRIPQNLVVVCNFRENHIGVSTIQSIFVDPLHLLLPL